MSVPPRSLRLAFLLGLLALLGFLSMGFQLVASRLLAPYFGSSIIVWAFLISTFLAAFSIGSMLGGWLCRGRGAVQLPALLALAAAAALGFAVNTFAGTRILKLVESSCDGINLGLFLSCAALFLLPVAAISALPPICAQALSGWGFTSGFSSGLVYGVSTIGNIAGVMVTAFVLIPHFRISTLLLFWLAVSVAELAIFCVLLSRPLETRNESPGPALPLEGRKAAGVPLLLFLWLALLPRSAPAKEYEYESIYTHYTIVEQGTVVELRHMRKEYIYLESAVDLADPPRQVVAYTSSMFAGLFFKDTPRQALMIGLGGGGFNRLFNAGFTTATLQTVDIDAMALELSKKHTGFVETDRNRVTIEDGRRYIKKTPEKWDWVILDAFHGGYIPFHLKTKEFYEEIKKVLAPDGVLISNLHSNTMLYDSDVKTLQACFPQVMLFDLPDQGNVIAISVNYATPSLVTQLAKYPVGAANPVLRKYLDLEAIRKRLVLRPGERWEHGEILTDDYCPAEYLNSKDR